MSTWLQPSRDFGLESSRSLYRLSRVRLQLLRAVAFRLGTTPRHKQCVTKVPPTGTRTFHIPIIVPMSGIVDKISNLVVGDKSTKMDPKDEVFVGSIDQGTTSSRFLIFDKAGEPVAVHQEEFKQIYPNPGSVPCAHDC